MRVKNLSVSQGWRVPRLTDFKVGGLKAVVYGPGLAYCAPQKLFDSHHNGETDSIPMTNYIIEQTLSCLNTFNVSS